MSQKRITISVYESDLKAALKKMRALKRQGYKQMSFSRLVRISLRLLDLDDVPPPDTDFR